MDGLILQDGYSKKNPQKRSVSTLIYILFTHCLHVLLCVRFLNALFVTFQARGRGRGRGRTVRLDCSIFCSSKIYLWICCVLVYLLHLTHCLSCFIQQTKDGDVTTTATSATAETIAPADKRKRKRTVCTPTIQCSSVAFHLFTHIIFCCLFCCALVYTSTHCLSRFRLAVVVLVAPQ